MSYDYIIENINELNIYDRIEIIQILYNSILGTDETPSTFATSNSNSLKLIGCPIFLLFILK